MNYQNIEEEIKKYSEYFKLSQNTLSKLSNYYKEAGKQGIKFAEKLKKSLDEFYVEMLKEVKSTSYIKFLVNLYNEKKNFIEKINTFFSGIEKNFGNKLEEYVKDYKNRNMDYISKLSYINESLSLGKTKLEKWKTQYFDLCKYSLDLENKIKALSHAEKRETINKIKTQLKNNEEIKQLKMNNYKIEQININKLLESSETNYFQLINSIEEKDVERMQYIGNLIIDSNKNMAVLIQDLTEHNKNIEIIKKTLNAKNDWRSLRKEFNFNVEEDINKIKRFIHEEFLDYDSMKTSGDLISNNKIEGVEELNRAKKIINMGQYFFADLDNLNQEENEINKIIINLISNDNKITNDDFLIMYNYANNKENCSKFIDILTTHFCQENFVMFKNYDNMNYLNNILTIILNNTFDGKCNLDVTFLIIFLVEKSGFIGNNKDPIYFFEILLKKSVFEATNFWNKIIEEKIGIISRFDINKEYNKRMKNVTNKKNNLESELMLKQIFNEKVGIYFTEVFYSFLKHFTHFNFYNHAQILFFFNEKYKLDKTLLDFFNTAIKSDTIFKAHQKSIKNINKSNKKILFDYKPNKLFKKIEEKKIKCILFSLKYLNTSDYISIMHLSKKYYKQIIKVIYKQILLKKENLDIKSHILIWKILLNYKQIKEEYDYNKIVESNNKDKNKIILNESIIQMDLTRTHFTYNKEENKIKLGNILKAISSEFPEINYFQGMNQVAAFLLNICNYNEEETFYLFVCFIKNTDYCSIYKNNLEKMNTLFYQFDRLLNLYLPGIYIILNQSAINAGFFFSPWIITLCANFFDDSNENNNNKSIMLILDMFLFSGWKIFIKVGIVLLKNREKDILENFSESLLPFLTGNLLKTEIIDRKHFEEFREDLIDIKYNIKTELFNNIEEEFNIKKNIEFFKEGAKINSAF